MFDSPESDFTSYWTAAQLHLAGQNPYDPELMASAQWDMGQRFDQPTLVYNPPWTFALLSAFTIWPYPVARSLWLVASLIIMFAAGHLSWRFYSDDRRLRWVGWALALTFPPALVAARIGQITPFILGGVVLFLLLIQKQKWGWAGVAAAFIAIKPQLIYLFWPALLLWVIVEKRWSVIIGLAAALLGGTAVAMLTNPYVIPQFIALILYHPPEQYSPPTWGTLLRLFTAYDSFALQFAPIALGLIWLAFYGYRQRQSWNWLEAMPWLLLVSMVTTPYGWSYDLVVILPAIIQTAVILKQDGRVAIVSGIAAVYLAITGLIFFLRYWQVYDFWLFWAPAVLLLLYWAAITLTAPTRREPVNVALVRK